MKLMLLKGVNLRRLFASTPLLQVAPYYWDVWYSDYTNAVIGTFSWVFLMLVTLYFFVKWRKNTDKFYEELKKQQQRAAG